MRKEAPIPSLWPLTSSSAGLLRRLKGTVQPIKDGHEHLVLLCETVEAIYRKGLKSKRHKGMADVIFKLYQEWIGLFNMHPSLQRTH